MITMATYGIGMWIGTKLSGIVKDYFTINSVVEWKSVWMVPAAIAAVVLVIFVLLFRDKATVAKEPETEPVLAM
jgi:nitrate/nitrite transporter NarK